MRTKASTLENWHLEGGVAKGKAETVALALGEALRSDLVEELLASVGDEASPAQTRGGDRN